QVFGAALGHTVRELGDTGLPHHVNVLDLDVATAFPGAFEQNVDPAVLAILHLAAQLRVAAEAVDYACVDGLRDERVRPRRVDADERRALPEVGLDHLPGMPVLAGRAVALRQPHDGAGLCQPS